MAARPLIRIVLSLGIIALLWTRGSNRGGGWLVGSIALTVLLVLVVIAEITQARRKRRKPPQDVPKRPLGLDS